MRIATLFDGAGLARLGLEKAGHICTGYEIDPLKHMLSLSVGSGNCILADATQVNISEYDAVWASPPCQCYSMANSHSFSTGKDYLAWCLSLTTQVPVVWVENVYTGDYWGRLYNAAQFLPTPIQSRNRIVGGNYIRPKVYHRWQKYYKGVCPTIMATEYKGSPNDHARACRFYGRKLTLEECAYHQGFTIPAAWSNRPAHIKPRAWLINQYEAIGNGVPVYMAQAFGSMYK